MIEHDGHLHTGNTGTTCLIDTLTRYGRPEVMYQIATTPTYPGWGYMIENGATVIWKSWGADVHIDTQISSGGESMIMWATIDEFLYNDLAGIQGPDYYGPSSFAPGFKQIVIKPQVVGDLKYAGASVKTVRGIVSSHWKRKGRAITLDVVIPVNSTARVSVPKAGLQDVLVTESGRTIWEAGNFVQAVSGIAVGSETDDGVTFDVGSGSYAFQLTGR